MAKPTILEVYKKLERLHNELSAMGNIVMNLQTDVRVLNEYMIGEKAVEAYRKGQSGNGHQVINKELVNVVLKFLAVLSTALGIVYLLVKEAI